MDAPTPPPPTKVATASATPTDTEDVVVVGTAKNGRRLPTLYTCHYCQRGQSYWPCLHTDCPHHFHTLHVLERHERTFPHTCGPDCPICTAIQNNERIDYSLREKKIPPSAQHRPAHPEVSPSTFSIPFAIKKRLVDDTETIGNEGSLVPLPRPTTVRSLLAKYREGVNEEAARMLRLPEETIRDALVGIEDTFDAALGRVLLLKLERTQYAKLLEAYPGRRPGDLYGAEHLARLLVKLPQLLADAQIEKAQADAVMIVATDLLQYIDSAIEIWTSEFVQPDLSVLV